MYPVQETAARREILTPQISYHRTCRHWGRPPEPTGWIQKHLHSWPCRCKGQRPSAGPDLSPGLERGRLATKIQNVNQIHLNGRFSTTGAEENDQFSSTCWNLICLSSFHIHSHLLTLGALCFTCKVLRLNCFTNINISEILMNSNRHSTKRTKLQRMNRGRCQIITADMSHQLNFVCVCVCLCVVITHLFLTLEPLVL